MQRRTVDFAALRRRLLAAVAAGKGVRLSVAEVRLLLRSPGGRLLSPSTAETYLALGRKLLFDGKLVRAEDVEDVAEQFADDSSVVACHNCRHWKRRWQCKRNKCKLTGETTFLHDTCERFQSRTDLS